VSSSTKLFVFDIDQQQWMPPWDRAASCITSGETAAGDENFLIAVGDQVLKLTPDAYRDDGIPYTAGVTLGLADLVPDGQPGNLGEMEYVGLETDSVLPVSVKVLTDDDPLPGTFTDLTSYRVDAPRRVQGTYLKESWYYSRRPAARRAAIQANWEALNSNFRLYAIDIAFKDAP
jgi:hypothetical protein